MKSVTVSLIILALLLAAFSTPIVPAAEAAPPKALKTFSGSLDPGGITDPPLSWKLSRDVQEFLFHYVITGGSEPDDVVYVNIDGTAIAWDSLMGEGWDYCDCSLAAGSYNVTVQADENASGELTYTIGFSLTPQPPVDFSGFFPANSSSRSNDFSVAFPDTASHQVVLGVTSGDYEFFVDGESKGVVNETIQVAINFTSGFHAFDIIPGEGDVSWSIQILGPPKLEVSMIDLCPILNPQSGLSKCVIGANATASDGGTPIVSYHWNASGGKFNSTSSQWIEWTAPPGVANFTLTVQASAPGYTSGTDSLAVTVAPEFPSGPFLFLVVAALIVLLMIRRTRRSPAQLVH
jgi:hypothetical protein